MKEKRPFGVCLWLMLLTCIVSCGSLYLYAWNTQVVAYPYWVDTLTCVRWYLVAIVATTLICAIIVRVVMMDTIQKARDEEKKKNVKSKVPSRTVRPVAPNKPQMQPQPHFRPKTTDVNVEQEVSSNELLAILNKVDEHHRQQQKPSVPEPLYSSEPYAEPISEDAQNYNESGIEPQVPTEEEDYKSVEPQTNEELAPQENAADNKPVQNDENPLDALDEILGEEQFDKSKFTEQEIAFLNRMDDILNRAGINVADFSLGECIYGRISLFVKEIPNRYGKVERVWQVTDANGKLMKSDTRITEAGKAFAKIFKNG